MALPILTLLLKYPWSRSSEAVLAFLQLSFKEPELIPQSVRVHGSQ